MVSKYQRKTPQVDGDVLKSAIDALEAKIPLNEVARTSGVPRSTLFRYRKKLEGGQKRILRTPVGRVTVSPLVSLK